MNNFSAVIIDGATRIAPAKAICQQKFNDLDVSYASMYPSMMNPRVGYLPGDVDYDMTSKCYPVE